MQMTLSIENIGGPIAEDTLEVTIGYTADGVEEPLTLNILAADEIEHEFSVSVPPGVIRFDVDIHGESFPFDRVAKAADLEIVDTEWEAVSDGRIVVNATVQNAGNADAEGIIVIGVVEDDDGAVTEGKGQTELIRVGESRTVEVLLNLPADEHEIQLRVTTASLEADVHDNQNSIEANVTYVKISFEYAFTQIGYWWDGSADVELSVKAINTGVGAFRDIAEVSYACAGADIADEVATGRFRLTMPNGFSSSKEEITLRSEPGTVECRFISQEHGTETLKHEVPAKIVNVSREVWNCYSDNEVNEHGDIGCAGREAETVVKWDLDRPLRVWATGDPDYIDVLWATLDRLSPLLGMTFTNVPSQDDADLKAWVGMTREEGPERWKTGLCAEASGCATVWDSTDGRVSEAWIGVWLVESDWLQRVGLIDRRIEHVTLHELLHALVPMDHRDDPLSAVNNINAPDWIELDPLEEGLIRLHRDPLIKPGMTMSQVRELVALSSETLDSLPVGFGLDWSPMVMLRKAFRKLQKTSSATWQIEGGWGSPLRVRLDWNRDRGGCSPSFEDAEYTIAQFNEYFPEIVRFSSGSDELLFLSGEEWRRAEGRWSKDDPEFWERTDFRPGFSRVHLLLLSAFFFGPTEGIQVSNSIPGETSLSLQLDQVIAYAPWWSAVELHGTVILDDHTMEIKGYDMRWWFDVDDESSCDGYLIRATRGRYGVPIDVVDEVYEGTSDANREAIDEVNGRR